MPSYLVKCKCGRTTSKSYAKSHNGQCKACADPDHFSDRPTRNERILESGYDAYAREEGHYDLPDDY